MHLLNVKHVNNTNNASHLDVRKATIIDCRWNCPKLCGHVAPEEEIQGSEVQGAWRSRNRSAAFNLPSRKHGGGYSPQSKKSWCTNEHESHVLVYSDGYSLQQFREDMLGVATTVSAVSMIRGPELQTLWLQRLPANLQQVLSVCKAPLDELTQIADKVHEVSGSDLTVARIETKSNQIELDVLKAEIADLKNMVKKLTVSAYSPNRNGYRSRSLTSSRGFDKNKARSKRLCWYHFHFGDKASKLTDVSDPIIGADFLERFELLIDVRNRRLLVGLTSLFVRGTVKQAQSLGLTLVENNSLYNSILSKYTKWFSTNLQPSTNESSVFHCIETKGPPVHARTRRLNPERLAYLKHEFGDLMRQGIIRPSKSSYASSIHFVKKSDGSWRICGDFQRLNSVTIPDRYPLPHIHDFVSGLRGKTVFSKIDLVKAYHQISMEPNDIPKTAVITPIGLFEYVYMTFGLRNAAQTMQRFIDSIIRDIPCCYAYVDDLLIASADHESHKIDLDLAFSKLGEHGIIVNPQKCVFGQSELKVLGFLVSSNGAAEEQACLHDLVKNKVKRDNTPVVWNDVTKSAFESCKKLITNATALSFPAADARLSLMTDASDFAVGSVLQQHIETTVEPHGFFSRKLSATEKKYSTFDPRFSNVHIDVVGPLSPVCGMSYLLTCVDRFTTWPEVFPIPDQTADTIARTFLLGWIARFGVPERITSDCGTNFQSNLFSSLSKFLGVEQIRTTSFHPQSNGAVERFHRHLKSALMTHLPESWLDSLPMVLLGIRSSFKQDLEASSAELVYGTTLKLPGEFFVNTPATTSTTSFLQSLRQHVRSFRPVPVKHHGSNPVFISKDLLQASHVFLRIDRVRKALEPPYAGPFKTVNPLRHLRFPHQNRRKMSSLAVEDVPDESCDFKCHRLCDWRGSTVASQLNLKTIFIQSCLRHVSSRPIGRD
ncbi:retrovirus-related Pol polyprotein from transposon opus [Trichonephila clavipes]|nr:retrovirus-related Pol polyprotein from transposon opus [Trichonephila clavipes]